jgi:hypothetical protein
VVSFTHLKLYHCRKSLRYQLDRRLGGSKCLSGRYGDEKDLFPLSSLINAILIYYHSSKSRNRSVSTVTTAMGWTPGVRFTTGARLFYVASRPRLWPNPTSYPLGIGGFSQGVERQGHELITHLYLLLRSRMAEYASTPPYVFMAWCFTHSDNFVFYRSFQTNCTLLTSVLGNLVTYPGAKFLSPHNLSYISVHP